MNDAEQIRADLSEVSSLRASRAPGSPIALAVSRIKALQRFRFAQSYADLIHGERFRAAALFFMRDLYGIADYSQRDDQFSRIASSLQRLFPSRVSSTASDLAQLHLITEQLDHGMAVAWLARLAYPTNATSESESDAHRFVAAWRTMNHRTKRYAQLAAVLKMGNDLAALTRTPGLRTLLRLMRSPAHAAGMGALQEFLESGFDTFVDLSRHDPGAQEFPPRVRIVVASIEAETRGRR